MLASFHVFSMPSSTALSRVVSAVWASESSSGSTSPLSATGFIPLSTSWIRRRNWIRCISLITVIWVVRGSDHPRRLLKVPCGSTFLQIGLPWSRPPLHGRARRRGYDGMLKVCGSYLGGHSLSIGQPGGVNPIFRLPLRCVLLI